MGRHCRSRPQPSSTRHLRLLPHRGSLRLLRVVWPVSFAKCRGQAFLWNWEKSRVGKDHVMPLSCSHGVRIVKFFRIYQSIHLILDLLQQSTHSTSIILLSLRQFFNLQFSDMICLFIANFLLLFDFLACSHMTLTIESVPLFPILHIK